MKKKLLRQKIIAAGYYFFGETGLSNISVISNPITNTNLETEADGAAAAEHPQAADQLVEDAQRGGPALEAAPLGTGGGHRGADGLHQRDEHDAVVVAERRPADGRQSVNDHRG